MARGGASAPFGYLLNQAGVAVDPGAGAPMRVSQDQGLRAYTGPNATEYQKQLLLQIARSIAVIQPTAFQRVVTQGFNLTTADVLAITSPPEIRAFLSVRNSSTSTGNVLIAFDQNASEGTAAFSLLPGGILFLDTFVPQNDIHLAAASGTCVVVIAYANARFVPSPS